MSFCFCIFISAGSQPIKGTNLHKNVQQTHSFANAPTVPEGHKHRVTTPGKPQKIPRTPAEHRRDPAEPSERPRGALWETPRELSERQSLAEGCAPRMVTLWNVCTWKCHLPKHYTSPLACTQGTDRVSIARWSLAGCWDPSVGGQGQQQATEYSLYLESPRIPPQIWERLGPLVAPTGLDNTATLKIGQKYAKTI